MDFNINTIEIDSGQGMLSVAYFEHKLHTDSGASYSYHVNKYFASAYITDDGPEWEPESQHAAQVAFAEILNQFHIDGHWRFA